MTIAAIRIAVLAGCNDDEPAADSSSPTTEHAPTTEVPTTSSPATTAPPETTTTPATVAQTTAATPPPPTTPPTIAPDDWEAILEELSRRRVALYAAPDLTRIGEYCAPGSDCAMELETQLSDAIAKGQHIEGQHPFDVTSIEQALVGEPSPVGPVASVIFVIAPETPPPARLVDAAGNVIDELSLASTPTRGAFTLASWKSDPSLPWRVVLAEDLGPVP